MADQKYRQHEILPTQRAYGMSKNLLTAGL
jgi:hypothetical protein